MTTMDDLDYYRRRAQQESDAARHARDAPMRRLHLDLASRYAERIAEAELRVPGPRMGVN
ncbi:hypothetical protein K7957_14035 [Sphingomonas yunnanensis]|uniref:hypothetical protein n=1 Tax=Sphingomonas yunnanensis TaxID=310400 RepID=UPI001CA6583F|nr:hypothetical protein [Sphingomonas yunnanensis]MBY9064058.1 hypothetical protein [Sphingomonas yunnanensis]